MNEELQNAFDSIFDAKVPRIWLRKSWVSSTLGFWFTELIDRNKQFSSWLFKVMSEKTNECGQYFLFVHLL